MSYPYIRYTDGPDEELLSRQAQPDPDQLYKLEPECFRKEEPDRYLNGIRNQESDSSMDRTATRGPTQVVNVTRLYEH